MRVKVKIKVTLSVVNYSGRPGLDYMRELLCR